MRQHLDLIKYFTGVLGASLSFIAVKYTKVIGPPNPGPDGSAAILSLVLLLVWTAAYFYFKPYRSNQATRNKWNKRFIILAAVFGTILR